jgi:transcriptional regulator with XRE-family HTH domain
MVKRRRSNELSLGSVLKRRRRQLEMTQAQVSDKVGCRANYIAYIESDARRPSPGVVAKLAKALDLDQQELYFLAYPEAQALMRPERPQPESAWLQFKGNKRLHTRHGVTRGELAALERVAGLGPVRSQRDFLFVLQAIRQALTDE